MKVKKALTLLLALVCVFAMMTVSASAETLLPESYVTRNSSTLVPLKIQSVSRYGYYLNVLATTLQAGKSVTVYSPYDDPNTQNWLVYRGSDDITTVRPAGNLMLGIGYSGNGECRLVDLVGAPLSTVEINHPFSYNGAATWTLQLKAYGSVLGVNSTTCTGGYRTNWAAYKSTANNQKWYSAYA